MNTLEILLGQVPEALYFAIFMILTKRLTTKRLLFTSLMIIEYILLFSIIRYSTWSHVFYFGISYLLLKILYKEKCQITDIFTLGIASVSMMIINIVSYGLFCNINYLTALIVDRLLMFILLFCIRKHLYKIQNMYKKFWNRNDKVPKLMKSATFRCINLVVFNIMFYIINAFMIYCLFRR